MADAKTLDRWRRLWQDPNLRRKLLPSRGVEVEWHDDDDDDTEVLGSTDLTGILVAQNKFPASYRLRTQARGDFMAFSLENATVLTNGASPDRFRRMFAFEDLSTGSVFSKASDPRRNAAYLLTKVLNDLNCQNNAMESVFGTFIHHVAPWILLQKSAYINERKRARVKSKNRKQYNALEAVVSQLESLGVVTYGGAALAAAVDDVLDSLGANGVRFFKDRLQPTPLTLPFAMWNTKKNPDNPDRAGMGFNADLVLECNTAKYGPTILVIELKTTYVDDMKSRDINSAKMNEYQRQAAMQALALSFATQDSNETVIPIVSLVHVPRSVEVLPRNARDATRKNCRVTSVIGNAFKYKSRQARRIVADMIDVHVGANGVKRGFELVKGHGANATTVTELKSAKSSLVRQRFHQSAAFPWINAMW